MTEPSHAPESQFRRFFSGVSLAATAVMPAVIRTKKASSMMPELPSLPEDYIRFLGTHDGTTSFSFDGRNSWWLFTKDDLEKEIRVDRRKTVTISQLRSFAESLKDLGADSLEDQDENLYALERLTDGLAIGSNSGAWPPRHANARFLLSNLLAGTLPFSSILSLTRDLKPINQRPCREYPSDGPKSRIGR